MTKKANENYYTVSEMASLLEVSVNKVYRLMKSGEIQHHRLGRAWRVKVEDFNNYLEEKGLA